MRLAQAWQRLVKRRWTDPARAKALQIRGHAVVCNKLWEDPGSPEAIAEAKLLEDAAAALERLASAMDDLVVPEDEP